MALLGIKDEWMPWIAAGLAVPLIYLGEAITNNKVAEYFTIFPQVVAQLSSLITSISSTGINALTGMILAFLLLPPIVNFIAVKIPKEKNFWFIGILAMDIAVGLIIGKQYWGIS